MERWWRSSSGGRIAVTNGSSRISASGLYASSGSWSYQSCGLWTLRSPWSASSLEPSFPPLTSHHRTWRRRRCRSSEQVRDRSGIEAEVFLRNHGDETGAGLECRVVKLAVALVLLEMGGVGRRQKSAFVVIEPPGDFGRTGIFKIDDGVFVAIKLLLVKQRTSPVQQAGIYKVCIVAARFVLDRNGKTGPRSKLRRNICRDRRRALANPVFP